jgi:hypothetical protein
MSILGASVKQMGFLKPYINCIGHLASNDIIMNNQTGTQVNHQNVSWGKQTSRPVMDPKWA